MEENILIKLLYKDIANDEQLNMFFQRLSTYFDVEAKQLIENYKTSSYSVMPKLYDINTKISKLEEIGFALEHTSSWISDDFYLSTSLSAFNIFNKVTFNGYKITGEHLEIFRNALKNENNPNYIKPKTQEEKEYDEWCRNNQKTEILLKASKYAEKYGESFSAGYSKLPTRVLKIRKDWLKYCELNSKSRFFETLSLEEMKEIVETYDLIYQTKLKCELYSMKVVNEENLIEETKNELFSKALTTILEKSMCEINIDSIVEKLFIMLISRKVKLEKDNSDSQLNYNNLKTEFHTNAVDWFLRLQKDKLEGLYALLSEQIDIAVKAGIEKVLKKENIN